MLSTDFVPGAPCWLDLGAPDVGRAAAFYGAVFGWDFESAGEGGGEYGLFRLGGRIVAAAGRLTEEGARSAWTLYFSTPDAAGAAARTEELGGTVRVPPMDADGEGRMAQLSDHLGGQFAVWQPGNTRGLDSVDEPGALMWIELYTTDLTGAKDFYGGLFGWETQDIPLPGGGGTYSMISPAGGGQDLMQGGMMEMAAEHLVLSGGRPSWHPVFQVEDCDRTVARVTENGGSVQMGPEDAEGVGRLAVCLDPSNADFVVLTPSRS